MIATVALLPIQFVVVWPNRQAVFGDSVAFYVLSTQLALVTEVARGALEGLAVAIGLNAIGEPIQAGQAPVDTRGDAPGAPEPEQ